MKYSKQHKTLLLFAPAFSSGSSLQKSVLHLKKVYEKFIKKVNLVEYDTTYALEILKNQHVSEDAILILGNARRHPKTACVAPFILKEGKKIPVGWLPVRNAEDILGFSETLEKVHSREQDDCVIALLSQRHPRFTRLVHRMERILEGDTVPLRWSSDVILREDVVNGLEEGIGLAAYFGHGRPIGWVGYYGFRAHHFSGAKEPIGGLLSLCCKTASRKNTKLSFCEDLVLNRKCAATFGAVDSTLHTDNTRWSVGLCNALLKGAKSMGDVVVSAMPQNKTAYASYRLIGDPLAPVYSTSKVSSHAQQIRTYS